MEKTLFGCICSQLITVLLYMNTADLSTPVPESLLRFLLFEMLKNQALVREKQRYINGYGGVWYLKTSAKCGIMKMVLLRQRDGVLLSQ